MENAAIFFTIAYVAILYSALFALLILTYVFESLALSTMLKATGSDKPWIAWVPFANTKALGDLADLRDNGNPKRGLGKLLLKLKICLFIFLDIFTFFYFIATVLAANYNNVPNEEIAILMLAMLVFAMIFLIVSLVFSIVLTVYTYISIWQILNIFCDYNPTGLLILCILVSESLPFVLFAIRNNPPHNLRTDEPAPILQD